MPFRMGSVDRARKYGEHTYPFLAERLVDTASIGCKPVFGGSINRRPRIPHGVRQRGNEDNPRIARHQLLADQARRQIDRREQIDRDELFIGRGGNFLELAGGADARIEEHLIERLLSLETGQQTLD